MISASGMIEPFKISYQNSQHARYNARHRSSSGLYNKLMVKLPESEDVDVDAKKYFFTRGRRNLVHGNRSRTWAL